MARAVTQQRKTINAALVWGIDLLIFFPILWTILTRFKSEAQAISDPPVFSAFDWTLEYYSVVMERSDYMCFLWNSVVIVLTLMILPIIVWMLYTYFKEIPGEILEDARMDRAGLREEILYVLTPMAIPGVASTLLLNFILAWNEAFWTLNLTAAKAAPLTAFIASYSSPEGLFYANSARPRRWRSRRS